MMIKIIELIKRHEVAILVAIIILLFAVLILFGSYVIGGDVCNCTQCNISAEWREACVAISEYDEWMIV